MSFEFLGDGIGRGRPHNGHGIFVVSLGEAIGARGEVLNAFELTALDGPLDNDAEPALDLVHPGCVGRCEMDMKARAPCKQGTHLGMFGGGVIIHHKMNVEVLGNTAFNVAQKR